MIKKIKHIINLIRQRIFYKSLKKLSLTDYDNSLKVEKKENIINIYKKNKCIRISSKHLIYLPDVIKLFDFYYSSIKPTRKFVLDIVDFSYPHPVRVKGYKDHKIMFPSFAEPIITTNQYISFAKLKEDSIVIDLGSYSGLTSILFDKEITKSNKNAKGMVISVDADPVNIPCIEYNLAEYKKKSRRNINYIHAVASDKDGVIKFSCEGNMGASTVDIVGSSRGGYIKEVPSMSLSSIAEKFNLKKIDFIKCDIEGSEMYVFKDSKFFNKYNPSIIVETHYLNNYTEMTTEPTKKVLESYGYVCEQVCQQGFDLPLLFCIRNKK